MSGWGDDPLDDAGVRERLLGIAREVVRDLQGNYTAAKQAATAQAVLLRDGLEGLRQVLKADYDGGGTVAHWRQFRAAFGPQIERIIGAAPGAEADAVAFTLGWIRRLSEIDAKGGRATRRFGGGRTGWPRR